MIGFLGIGKHHRVRGLLSAYIDGQVSETESRRVEEHLDLCDECGLELDTLRSTVDLLNRLPELAVPRSFALSEAPAPVVPSPPFTSAVRLVAPVAAAVLVMLVVGDALGIVSQSDLGERPEVLSTSAVSKAQPEVLIEKEVVKELAVAVEKPVEMETAMEVEVEKEVVREVIKEVAVAVEKAVEAVAVAEAGAAEEPVEEPGDGRSADAPEAPRELPPPRAQSAEAKAPVAAVHQAAAPTPAIPEATEDMAKAADEAAPVQESEGLGLPLWQIEVAVGGLLAVLLVIAFRGWRRTGRETD